MGLKIIQVVVMRYHKTQKKKRGEEGIKSDSILYSPDGTPPITAKIVKKMG